ncbi:histidine phosphatase family protein [Pseudomonas sp. 32A]|uniref:histidine phosphatase family protein n=1 Tax=Pseudomonas sp. 32A TaxID=651185 RepID=UPI0040461A3F
MQLYVVRHGETDANAEGRYQGSLDIDLNERGVLQAREAFRERGVGVVAKAIRALVRDDFSDFFDWQLRNGEVLTLEVDSIHCGEWTSPLTTMNGTWATTPPCKHLMIQASTNSKRPAGEEPLKLTLSSWSLPYTSTAFTTHGPF